MPKPLFSVSMELANCLVKSPEEWNFHGNKDSQAEWNAETVNMLADGAICIMAADALRAAQL